MLAAISVSTIVGIAIVAIVILAALMVAVAARRTPGTGKGVLDREALKRDAARERLEAAKAAAVTRSDEVGGAETGTSGALALRERETELAEGGTDLVVAPEETIDVYSPTIDTPPDPVEVGIARRQVLNRMTIAGMAVSLGAFGGASVAFLIPAPSKGFGGEIPVGLSIDEIKAEITENRIPFYVSEARTYLNLYNPSNEKAAEKAYQPMWDGIQEAGLMALFQKCPHLGCRVPWCETSQWFECPCHGSQYNAAGEKKGGPAPRGMDRFVYKVSGDSITIDTGKVITGPPIGTDTTAQQAEGPHCI